jgi:hypothetical protein
MTNENIQIPGNGTNVVLVVAQPSAVVPEHSRFGGWTWPAIGIVAVVFVLWCVKKLKKANATFEQSLENELVDSVLDVVAKDAPGHASLRRELANVVEGGGELKSGPLSNILRIEESYEKLPTGRYLHRISVLRMKTGTTAGLTKIDSEVGWESIPDAIRACLIQTRENKVVRLVYDAGKGSKT